MHELRAVHTMDVRGRSAFRHSCQTYLSHAVAAGRCHCDSALFVCPLNPCSLASDRSSNGWKPSSLLRKGAYAHTGPQRGV